MQQYILALDQGFTSSRAIIFRCQRKHHQHGAKEFAQLFPNRDGVEHDAGEIWSTQLGVAAEAISKGRIIARTDRGHRHHQPAETTVVWERATGKRFTMPSFGKTVARPFLRRYTGEGQDTLIRKKKQG